MICHWNSNISKLQKAHWLIAFILIFFQFYQCPYCNYNSRDPNRIQMHVLSQHSMQPVICCPLCQDVLSNKMHLQLHLTHLHSVSPDCVEKLLMTVSVPNTDAHATEMYLGLWAMYLSWHSIQVARGEEGSGSGLWGSVASSSSDWRPLGKWLKVDFEDAENLQFLIDVNLGKIKPVHVSKCTPANWV